MGTNDTRRIVLGPGMCFFSSCFFCQLTSCYDFRRLRQLSTVVVSKVRNQRSLEECKSWTCIVLLGLRAKVQVKGLSIKD